MNRRLFLMSATTAGGALWTSQFAMAAGPVKTPSQTEGPFYPNKLPLDTDNDLLVINNGKLTTLGEVTHLTGRILDSDGKPLKNVTIEIWQCDANGVYLHTGDSAKKQDQQDKAFQGFGRFTTASTGEYYFRTIKPVPYPGRTPHIHVKIKKAGKDLLTTQCYVKGHMGNDRDGVYRGIRDKDARDSVTVDFAPLKESKTSELAAKFDIVLGMTPEG